MRESLLNHKYTKVEDRTDLMVMEVTKPGQIVEIGYISQIKIQGWIIEVRTSEELLEGMVDKIIEKITGMKGIVVTIEMGVGQGKELLQGIMVITEIATQPNNRGLELVQIGIG